MNAAFAKRRLINQVPEIFTCEFTQENEVMYAKYAMQPSHSPAA